MRVLLRSCFVASPSDDKDLLFRNLIRLKESGLGFEIKEDIIIWTYIEQFAQAHHHVPDLTTIQSHFQRKREDGVVNRLHALSAIPSKAQGDFESYLQEKAEDRRQRVWQEALKEAQAITTTGLEISEGKGKTRLLQGPAASARYLTDKAHSILSPTFTSHLTGEVTGDAESFRNEYERIETDPLAGIGQFTGIRQMDEALSGAKKNELWVHAAFTGGMKSTFALNWMYNQAVGYKHDSLIFSLEMPYIQCRRIFYSIHSFHRKFRPVRYALGLQKHPEDDVGLDYIKIRDAKLAPNEKTFLLDYVVPDFADPNNKYGKIHIEAVDPDKSDFNVNDLRQKAEILYSKSPFSSLFVDHMGLMNSRGKYQNTTERLNEVLRDLKRLSMSFNRGQGMAIVGLFQISREGFKAAEKAAEKDQALYTKGPYNLTMLSYANEAERSADIVTASYVNDELRAKNRVLFQNLKSRDQGMFKPFVSRVEWPCRRILTCDEMPTISLKDTKEDVDKLIEAL